MNRPFLGVPDFALKQREELLKAFNGLLFEEETHTYTTPNGVVLTPTSDMIKNFYTSFDANGISIPYAKSRNLELNDVRGAWDGEGDIATTYGTKVHNFAEDYGNHTFFNEDVLTRTANCKKELGVLQWFQDRCILRDRYIPLVFELKMFSEKYGYAGTADLIMRDKKSGKIVIADWKTNSKDLKSLKFTKRMLSPFDTYRDTTYMKYTLQLSFYQILLEDMGFDVVGREIVWLNERKEQKSLYTPLFPSNKTEKLRKWLNQN